MVHSRPALAACHASHPQAVNHSQVIVSRHSYGKGTVQTHFPLNTASAVLKLTAVQVVQTGIPTQLAQAAGQGKRLSVPTATSPRVFEELPAPATER